MDQSTGTFFTGDCLCCRKGGIVILQMLIELVIKIIVNVYLCLLSGPVLAADGSLFNPHSEVSESKISISPTGEEKEGCAAISPKSRD